MPLWKRNMIFCWFGMFVTGVGMSQIAPILPLYIQHMGVADSGSVARLSGLAFGITFILSAVFSPIWGAAADKVGRKPMLLRASLGMAVVIFCMGFATNVPVLIGLRLLQGIITGFSTACTALIAAQTDREHAGWALGTLSTANVSGGLLGPMIGGFMAQSFGLRYVFFITGALMLAAFFMTVFFVKETFVRDESKKAGTKGIWGAVPEKSLTLTLFVTFFILTAALYSAEPIITLYIAQLAQGSRHIALIAGITFSASGVATIFAAPRLGKLSDRIGAHKVILAALAAAGLIFIPQAFVSSPWELMGLRFLLGLTAAGLTPSVNVLLKKITPASLTGRMFGFSMSAGYLGVFAGSVLGGQVAAWLGIRCVFLLTGALLLLNAAWVYYKLYQPMKERSAT
ncbi:MULTISPECIES: multidrug efflux MFS transporter [unclassified Paenibacillus]|uniref:multidrug efflux MFS transporter n=1 Tax=unclassified Paenibacillus TaxID=185978 RepID=UPI00095572F0|nr:MULTISPECIES: multidrug efflux MFS transporter [unclassified Paenibacillus]ASS64813.1 multidrug efflux MFS transporter [Paenibacillus sp. RUD330]SIR05157.1 Predicted arabinose efflux permease, MFS family [Paenibacillus sp. RU4X]SIR30195.1 Predicted arabinose efflux permease, MFS family [Paenibacillus sp. RU4T]